jgi:Ca2+-binding EF-hand superfamily protein
MQISSTPTAYGGSEAQRLLNMLLQPQAPAAGQDLPGAASTTTTTPPPTTTTPPATPPATPTSSPNAVQFATNTLASLLSAQEAPPSSSDIAAKIISVADTNGDGTLSLSEVETALGADTTSGANPLSQAFSAIDTNGDGQISASELTNALDAQKGAQGAQGAHHGHHHHHAEGAGGAGGASSTDLANQLISSADTNGDGQLSLTEVENALGSSVTSGTTDALSKAFTSLDTNGDGQLSATELSAGIDAFRAAHHRGGGESTSAQTVTA